jgi:hypothetical protein
LAMSRPIVVIVCMDAPPNRGSFNSAHIFGTHVPGGGAVHSIRSRPCCSFTGRLNSNNRCVHVIQGLRANVSEAHVAHPLPALRSGVLKASRGLDQHVEARQQRVSLDATPIVDERIVHDERTPPGSA